MAGIQESEPEVAAQLLPAPEEPVQDGEQPTDRLTPWRGFLRSGPVRPLRCLIVIGGNGSAGMSIASFCVVFA